MTKLNLRNLRIGVVGLGYVGLPLAVEFGKRFNTVGFDIKAARVDELRRGHDSTLETDEAAWQQVVDTNLSGAFRVARAAAKAMVEGARGGTIINIASILAFRVAKQVPAYVAAKAGLIKLTEALALELASRGIRVNAIAPGYIETDLNREFLRSPSGQAMQARIALRRFGTAADLDGALLLLASDAGAYITGATIVVDGGHGLAWL